MHKKDLTRGYGQSIYDVHTERGWELKKKAKTADKCRCLKDGEGG